MKPNNFDVGIPSDAHKKLKFTSRGPGSIHILGSTNTEDWVKYIYILGDKSGKSSFVLFPAVSDFDCPLT
jgi:hypothetical protein